MKILIIKMSSLGDVVHTLPLAGVIKKYRPDAEIDWVVNPEYAELVEGNPAVRRVIPFKRRDWLGLWNFVKNRREIKQFALDLKREHYDLVFDVQGLAKSALVDMMASGRQTIGFANAREFSSFFYSRKIKPPREMHAVDRYLLFASCLGIEHAADDVEFSLPVTDAHRQRVREHLAGAGIGDKPYVVFCPFARWETKRWPEQNFHELERLLEARGVAAVWTGGPGDRLSRQVRHDMIGKLSVLELSALMTGSRAVVTGDSGPMHIAVASQVPLVAIFGPTSERRTGPYGGRTKPVVLRNENVTCAPCFRRSCDRKRICMDVPPLRVLAELTSHLPS